MTRFPHSETLLTTSMPGIKLFSRGKVRDIYELSGDRLLMVATDRLSAFDVVMTEGIPNKGRVLTHLSCFWFRLFWNVCPNHFLTANFRDYPSEVHAYAEEISNRSMLVRKARPFPIECVVRGYLAGSGWKEYKETGEICGIRLPMGLKESCKLEKPILTPATKAASGHDENIDFEEMSSRIGHEQAVKLRDLSIDLYTHARDYAATRGIIIADTKFEWGLSNGEIILIDEVLTPDSSRFWPQDGWELGRPQPSFDKQFVRDYLETTGWRKKPPPPHLPPEIVKRTSEKYREALRRITGEDVG